MFCVCLYPRTSIADGQFERVDLNTIVDAGKDDLKQELTRKSAVIESTGLGEANVIPFQFRQLLNNLFSNWLKFSKPVMPLRKKIKGEIISGSQTGVAKLNAANKYWHVTIQDNGTGA